uniref:Uncharacterized protein ycf20 n=1 Tax=Aglaothamnion neglectum TaxID=2765 RepID=YCF20_AGLNE|nr:RecName: Full=Uncharacterized protein ycf20 [Aglaothamnion neglectum]AAA18512.1 unknown [Aglaothamnion neglectum]
MQFILYIIGQYLYYHINNLSLQLISLFLGYFFCTIICSIPKETGDWGLITALLIVGINETMSALIYSYKKYENNIIVKTINGIKIGIIYGLFVDSFKLGS